MARLHLCRGQGRSADAGVGRLVRRDQPCALCCRRLVWSCVLDVMRYQGLASLRLQQTLDEVSGIGEQGNQGAGVASVWLAHVIKHWTGPATGEMVEGGVWGLVLG